MSKIVYYPGRRDPDTGNIERIAVGGKPKPSRSRGGLLAFLAGLIVGLY